MPETNESNDLHSSHTSETCVTMLAWWQLEQSAWCPFCLQGYAWELHVACIECDRASCPLCVDREREAGPHCPECAGEAADHEPSAEASA
jgi:hypothetical protein